MNELLVFALLLPYYYLGTWWIVRSDLRRLPPEKLARCWNSASFGAAVLGFAPWCIIVHFIKAHGWPRGIPLGFVWTAALVVPPALLQMALE